MKIRKIHLENHPVLGNLDLDFTDDTGKTVNTILLAGENGSGKSNILNLIFDFSNFTIEQNRDSQEKREIVVEFSDSEIVLLNDGEENGPFKNGVLDGEVSFKYDFAITNNWGQIKVLFRNSAGEEVEKHGGYIGNDQDRKGLVKAIFSDVEINFNPNQITSVTAKNIDEDVKRSVRSSPQLATEITQLLIDVQALDDAELAAWTRDNVGVVIGEDLTGSRIQRFTAAFSYMFPTKRYAGVQNDQGRKSVMFNEFGKDVSINNLSSGEKQIIFRGGFLLKDRGNHDKSLVLIDEPEISLHPKWQLKILPFYKQLFTNQEGEQTSQIIFATHSPFVIHNEERLNDKVIILKRDADGKIQVPTETEYFGWTPEKKILEAFNISLGEPHKPALITEGKTDCALIRLAWEKLNPDSEIPFNLIASGVELKEQDRVGSARHVQRFLHAVAALDDNRLVVGLFDNDREGNQQFSGLDKRAFEDLTTSDTRKHRVKNIYGQLLPVPDSRTNFISADRNQRYLSIEHFFSNEILESRNLRGPSILGSEVFEIQGDKAAFAEYAAGLAADEFAAFNLIFERIQQLIAT